MIIAPVFAMLSPLPAITLDEVLRLPPEKVGERVLEGAEHGSIEAVLRSPRSGLQPPYSVDLELVEQGTAEPGGCSRRRWRTMFQHAPGAREGGAVLSARQAGLEIALTCQAEQFVHINPGLTLEQGFAGLNRLRQIQSGTVRVRFTCVDRTQSRLCTDDRTILSQLASLTPWGVTRRDDAVALWLGTSGQVVTEVRFDPADPNHLLVERRISPPA